jgi:hypothetical protein
MIIDDKSFKEVTLLIKKGAHKVRKISASHPTQLEKRMRRFLNRNHVKYLFQAIMYKELYGNDNYVEAFYIAPFYFPNKKIALEFEYSPAKLTEEEREYIKSVEGIRTYNVYEISHKIQSIKITEKDFEYPTFQKELLRLLK